MATNFKHNYKEFSNEAVARRVRIMVEKREQLIAAGVDGLHVRFSTGNRKTGAAVPSVSTIPVADCANCKVCKNGCYDVKNDCYLENVQDSRANNSAILHADPERYFLEIERYVRFCRFFRWHVGGDMLTRSYFLHMVGIAERVPECHFLAFTKLYGVVNNFLRDGGTIPANLHIIFSDWRGAEFENPYNLPISSPVWVDKSGVETERGPHTTTACKWCPGDCTECARENCGCWSLKNGETVLFIAH